MRRVAALIAILGVAMGCSDSGSVEAFCAQVVEVPQFSTLLDSEDPAAAFAGAVRSLRDLEEVSPSGIKDDVGRIADAAEAIVAALASGESLTDAGTGDALRDQLAAAAEASAEVVAFARERCGVDLTPATTPRATAPSTTTG